MRLLKSPRSRDIITLLAATSSGSRTQSSHHISACCLPHNHPSSLRHLVSHCNLFPKLSRVDEGLDAWPRTLGIRRTRLWWKSFFFSLSHPVSHCIRLLLHSVSKVAESGRRAECVATNDGNTKDKAVEALLLLAAASGLSLHSVSKAAESGQREYEGQCCIGSQLRCKSRSIPDCLFSQCVSMGTATLTTSGEVFEEKDHDRETTTMLVAVSFAYCINHRKSGSIAPQRAVSRFKRKNERTGFKGLEAMEVQAWSMVMLSDP